MNCGAKKIKPFGWSDGRKINSDLLEVRDCIYGIRGAGGLK